MADKSADRREADNAQIDFGLVERVPASAIWTQYRQRRSRLRWWLLGEQHEPPVSTLNPVVDPDPGDDRVGICCSGGGIRSASFNLGALQAVQDDDRLHTTRFLSAVSGGSYIAAAFAMVAKTRDKGPPDPPGDDSDPKLVTPAAPPFDRGSPEEQYLRNRASYMAPTGVAKAYLVWRVLLGLLVNLLLIGAALTLVAAGLSLYYRTAHPGLIRPLPPDVELGASPDGSIEAVALVISAIGVVFGALSILMRPRGKDDFRRFLELWSLRLFVFGLLLLFLEAVVPQLIDVLRHDPKQESAKVAGAVDGRSVGAGVTVSVAGILAAIVTQLRAQVADPVKAVREATSWLEKLAPRVRLVVIYLATAVLGPLVILAILVASTMVQVETTRWELRWGIPAGALVLLLLFMFKGDLNAWSLHPFYRSRLCTAFALRRVHRTGDPPSGRAEARAEGELVPMSQTYVRPASPPFADRRWPTLIVCAAANVSDPGAAPPGRGVTSFTFTAAEMGGPLVGGVETDFFESKLDPSRQRDFTLPAAVAMSGAAVAPSMGKLTRPSIRFLMAMANVRLGVWLPNPRRLESFVQMRSTLRSDIAKGVGQKTRAIVNPWSFGQPSRTQALNRASTKGRSTPRPNPVYLVKELLGWNSVNDKFLYVTDGGHYENLGVVELLRRGCRTIYCFDASGGKPLAQLGDAMALARSELGVEIEFSKEELANVRENKKGIAKKSCATGTLTYTRADPAVTGKIVYVPTVLTADLPWDVHALKEEDPQFPHHSTLDQLFTDQKFEAYRVLGYCGAQRAMKAIDSTEAATTVARSAR